jgi:hypothetical protein
VSLLQSLPDRAPIEVGIAESYQGRHSARRRDQSTGRWLLTARDRADGDELPLNHEFLSMRLGTRRIGATLVLVFYRRRDHFGPRTVVPRSWILCRFGGRCLRVLPRRQGATPISASARRAGKNVRWRT